MSADLLQRASHASRELAAQLLAELGPGGYWTGELSSSALSTATAVTALATVDRHRHAELIRGGLHWLAGHANPDGGWGDTVRSQSNLSTTALVWAAFGAARADAQFAGAVESAQAYIRRTAGSIEALVPAIEARYGQDRTFSVPITMALALSGRLGAEGWRRVRPLPFELAAFPRRFFRTLRLPVVSYALPALIAIGQVIHHHAPRCNPLRNWARTRTLELLSTLQPPNGGFLEATPLTSFVTMSLAAMGQENHLVTRQGAEFLRHSVRPDGSWPIDTNLATWVTTLAIQALAHGPELLHTAQRHRLREWLLQQQWLVEHPYTGAAAGGWAWTDLPGGVPDADDTAGALVALRHLQELSGGPDVPLRQAASRGVAWLLGVQNRDGGIPTFCRGWGTLPFDRSTPEITAHALRSWTRWLHDLSPPERAQLLKAVRRGLAFLSRSQRPDGSWVPLWFGNERAPGQENPTYGTAQVLLALGEIRAAGFGLEPAQEEAGRRWLLGRQDPSGGWGGALGLEPTVEETALALGALAGGSENAGALHRGTTWLLDRLAGGRPAAAPIGLYFAQLWYYERLYPLIFSLEALGRLRKSLLPDR